MIEKYDVDYFLKFYSAIPADKWIVGEYSDYAGGHCAIGFIPETHSYKRAAIRKLFKSCDLMVTAVNDNKLLPPKISARDSKTPKGRIMAALRWIKKHG